LFTGFTTFYTLAPFSYPVGKTTAEETLFQ